MRTRKLPALVITGAMILACSVEEIDFTNKTCPCPDDMTCDTAANRCVAKLAVSCVPRSCSELAIECGPTDDGCGGLLDCGTCALPNTTCNVDTHRCVCQPRNCAAQGAECGEVPSGCGEVFKCDACPPDRPSCGGAGANRCGTASCVPRTCEGRCGALSDGCGSVLDCGGCQAPAVCGGGGQPNLCGCTPKTCAQLGWQCGNGPDGCGGTLSCGRCRGEEDDDCSPNHRCDDD